jgi:hypothetical protein
MRVEMSFTLILSLLIILSSVNALRVDLEVGSQMFSANYPPQEGSRLPDLPKLTTGSKFKLYFPKGDYNGAFVQFHNTFVMKETYSKFILELKAEDILVPGNYPLKLYAFGTKRKKDIYMDIGNIEVDFFYAEKQNNAEKEESFEPLPEIKHIFKPAKVLPPVALPISFSVLVLLPWVVLIFGWKSIGINWSNFPSIFSVQFLFSSAFLVNLGGVIFIYFLYWTRLNVFEAFSLLTPSCLLLAFLGRQCLTEMACRSK